MIACIQLYDPTIACEQACLQRHGACTPMVTGDVKTCSWVKSLDYEVCLAGCKGIDPPTEDKCTFIGDKCNCEASGCGWCESTIYLDQPVRVDATTAPVSSIPSGYCSSVNSQFQCVYADATFSTAPADSNAGTIAAPRCNIVLPPQPLPLPIDPKLVEIDACLADSRCFSNTDLNTDIATAAQNAAPNTVSDIFYIVVTLVIRADGGIVNLAVDVSGDHEPTLLEHTGICDVLVNTMSNRLNFQKTRVESCNLAKVTNQGLKRAAVTSSYIANIRINEPAGIQGDSASTLVPALLLVAAALLA
jgi:hypothetical protein